MITEIGIVSGEILEFLEQKKIPVSITEIQFELDEPLDLINMSVGWLIRENYVRVIRGSEKYLSLAMQEKFSPQTFSKAFESAACAIH